MLVIDLKYPYGIWNTVAMLDLNIDKIFEVSLWDLKRSKIDLLLDRPILFEVSLWDLKQADTSPLSVGRIHLKYPYGIWNLIYN